MFQKSIFIASLFCFSMLYAQQNHLVKVNQDRLEKSIFSLAKFGTNTKGGSDRVAFTDHDVNARAYVISLIKKAGMDVHIDYAGNIIGRKAGTDSTKKVISFGSHIDTVPNGGKYDGCVGSMGAIEVVQTFFENNIKTEHPLELIIFSDEEGGLLGSRALAGKLGEEALNVVNSTGLSSKEGLQKIGGDPSRLSEIVRRQGDMAAFIELHIEQGGILDKEGIDIGVVEGIVGIKWWDVTFEGFANHGGTTPMDQRQDALLAAAQFIIAVNEATNSFEGTQVGTVGRIKAEPGAPNVIPGLVVTSLEIRDLSAEKIEMVFEEINKRTEMIAAESGVKISFRPIDATAQPALTDKRIQQKISEAAISLGFSRKQMQSGAGHDAQDMAIITPTGMIFVPSRNGISHSPEEFTTATDMANGANVLLQTILALDKDLE